MKIAIKKPLLYPIHLDIECTNYCNLECIMCPHSLMERSQGFMDEKLLRKILEESKGKTKTIFFQHMGEPLMHLQYFQLLQQIKSSNIWVGVSTNCMMLTVARSQQLFAMGVDHLTLCLDSLNKESFERIRKRADFDKVIENIETCIALRHSMNECSTYIVVQMIEMDENKNERERFLEIYNKKLRGIGKAVVKPFDSFAGLIQKETVQFLRPYECTMLNYSMSIYWNGDVVICCHDYDERTKVGNVLEQSIEEIWNSQKYNEYRRMHKDKDFSNLYLCRLCEWGGAE